MTTLANPCTVREGQEGTVFRATIKDDADDSAVDVSNASTLEMKFRKPDGTIVTKTAQFSTASDAAGDGTDGKVEFQDDAGEATDATGYWRYWAYAVLPGGFDGDSTTLTYEVEAVGSP